MPVNPRKACLWLAVAKLIAPDRDLIDPFWEKMETELNAMLTSKEHQKAWGIIYGSAHDSLAV